jgi:hypothetical protein
LVEEAKKELSVRHGQLPFFWSGTDAMDASFKRFLASVQSPVAP